MILQIIFEIVWYYHAAHDMEVKTENQSIRFSPY